MIEHNIGAGESVDWISHAGTALFTTAKSHSAQMGTGEIRAARGTACERIRSNRAPFSGVPTMWMPIKSFEKKQGSISYRSESKSILASAALMKKLNVFVSNDSALMHIAGALQLPTVAIFSPTNETYVHPWKTHYRIVHTGIECRPCFVLFAEATNVLQKRSCGTFSLYSCDRSRTGLRSSQRDACSPRFRCRLFNQLEHPASCIALVKRHSSIAVHNNSFRQIIRPNGTCMELFHLSRLQFYPASLARRAH